VKRHYSTLPWRNTSRLARLLSLLDKHATFLQAIFAHLGRQNQLFEQNATEREKWRDWLAERIGFELEWVSLQFRAF